MKEKKESHARFAIVCHTAKVMAVAHKLVNVNNTYVIEYSMTCSFKHGVKSRRDNTEINCWCRLPEILDFFQK